jgi:hypothetical protein
MRKSHRNLGHDAMDHPYRIKTAIIAPNLPSFSLLRGGCCYVFACCLFFLLLIAPQSKMLFWSLFNGSEMRSFDGAARSNALKIKATTTPAGSSDVASSVSALIFPNVLLVGAQKAGSTAVSEWLFSFSATCMGQKSDTEPWFFNKEPHFFDLDERFKLGKEFYASRFEHCSSSDLVIDATPDYALHATRIGDFYRQLQMTSSPDGLLSSLKVMMILREPVSRELSAYNHRKFDTVNGGPYPLERNYSSFDEYVEEQNSGIHFGDYGYYSTQLRKWFNVLKRDQILILSYHELKSDPTTFQRRIEDFLELPPNSKTSKMLTANENTFSGKEAAVSCQTRNKLAEKYRPHNQDLYALLGQYPGPPQEQRPFPIFEVAACQ